MKTRYLHTSVKMLLVMLNRDRIYVLIGAAAQFPASLHTGRQCSAHSPILHHQHCSLVEKVSCMQIATTVLLGNRFFGLAPKFFNKIPTQYKNISNHKIKETLIRKANYSFGEFLADTIN